MIVLGLDQAPSGSGWCYGDGAGPPTFGYREFSDYGGNETALMDHVFDWLVTFGKSIGAEAMCVEQIIINWKRRDKNGRSRSAFDTNTLHKQFAVYDGSAFACGKRGLMIDHYTATVAEWRSWFLGIGNGDTETMKALAMKECAQRNLYPENHHAAEAIGIWSWCLQAVDKTYRHREAFQQRRAQGRRDDERRERAA